MPVRGGGEYLIVEKGEVDGEKVKSLWKKGKFFFFCDKDQLLLFLIKNFEITVFYKNDRSLKKI